MKRIILFFFSIIAFIASCDKQEQFVSTDQYSEFAISYPGDTTLNINQLDTLRVTPVIEGLKDGTTYSYEWKLYVDDEPQILSVERNINEAIALPEGTYYMQFSAMDQATKVKAISAMYKLKVNGSFYEGWVVTNNRDGKGQLSFLRADGEVFFNPVEEINNKTYPGLASGAITQLKVTFYNSTVIQIMYFTDQGLTLFDPSTMLQIAETNQNIFEPIAFTDKPAYKMNSQYTDQYIIGNGNLYIAYGPDSYGAKPMETFSSRVDGDYVLFPYVFPDVNRDVFLYDNKNKRFLRAPRYYRYVNTGKSIGSTMLGADLTASSHHLCLMQNGSSYSILDCYLASTAGSTYAEQSFTPSEIDENPLFASSSLYYHGYYTAGNKIYKVNANNGQVSLLYTFANNVKIGDLKMMKTGTNANKMLVAAVNQGDQGEVHYIYLDDQGNYDSGKDVQVFTGFGNIVFLNYRAAS